MEAPDDAHTAQPSTKRRRVSKACGPCQLAHSACNRERPCKRCVDSGRPQDCVDISSSRRRGRPKRSQESAQQLQFNCAENESAVQSQHADQHAKRDVDLPEETSTFTEQGPDYRGDVISLLLRELKQLKTQVMELKKEVMNVRHTQRLHDTQFSLILPLLPHIGHSPKTPSSPTSSAHASASSSSPSPQSSSIAASLSPSLESVLQISPDPFAPSSRSGPEASSTAPSLSSSTALSSDAGIPNLTTASFFSQLATSPGYTTPLPLSTFLSSTVPFYSSPPQPHPIYRPKESDSNCTASHQGPTVQEQVPSTHMLRPHRAAKRNSRHLYAQGLERRTLYQQETVIQQNASTFSREGYGVPLAIRQEMLAYLPFLRPYNILSPDVPFVISDSRKPIVACRVPDRAPGEELRPTITFANSAFCELSNFNIDELLEFSVRKFILLEDPDTWEEFRKGVLPCLTMRSFIPLSPMIHLRALSKRKDNLLVRIRSRVQVFYDEKGYSRWYILTVDDYEMLGQAVHHAAPAAGALPDLGRQGAFIHT